MPLDPRFRFAIYAAFSILFLTGVGWLVSDQMKDAASGESWQGLVGGAGGHLMIHAPLARGDRIGFNAEAQRHRGAETQRRRDAEKAGRNSGAFRPLGGLHVPYTFALQRLNE